ncbi:protein PhnA [Sinobacterium caligoides]|uniref:Protein PhnA n=1 Tax=Sinobacterium caligoides TaxID=933926 RepID=A0A3N2DXT4_9GAMM|nr:alkylphosphonate utilization protein [Sinobacterium caligoides]ROS04597.1 protein PhnA [Sinobacterium caligoides]
MTEKTLRQRSGSKCELCAASDNLSPYQIPPVITAATAANSVLICQTCNDQLSNPESMEPNHWRGLNDSMWSTEPPVQVMAYRALSMLSKKESWAQDLIDMMYIEENMVEWAKEGIPEDSDRLPCRDSNGAVLSDGDTVTLTKDLVVKGANFTAKRGTAVRNISLTDNHEQIEGRVNGSRIVLLSCFLKKQ